MYQSAIRSAAIAVAVISTAAATLFHDRTPVTVHEWGTFTTVASPEGGVLEWLPLGGPQDLPCFVNVLADPRSLQLIGKVAGIQIRGGAGAPINTPLLNYEGARDSLRGTVRMETPVIYFHAERETFVDVKVDFPQGLVTEWYPPAWVTQPPVQSATLRMQMQSSIEWKGVRIIPNSKPQFPVESAPSHYYPARETGAAPVQVSGLDEKFLFYRGVGGFRVPLSVVTEEDGLIHLRNTGSATLPSVIYFENRGGKIGYQMLGALKDRMVVEPKALDQRVGVLHEEMIKVLMATGIYQDEATAMVKTWSDSWFEEGARIFYILPSETVDAVLPLKISPAPASVARAFAGRMELLTDETLTRVAKALTENDEQTLQAYGRFLSPIAERLISLRMVNDSTATMNRLNSIYRAYTERGSSRCRLK